MVVVLSELRVSASLDGSDYVRGAQAIDDANKQMAASGTLAGAQMAQQDIAAGKTGGTLVSLSKANVDGYASAFQFSKGVDQLQTQMETNNATAARATTTYTGLVNRFGMVADATKIAAGGNKDFASVVDGVNQKVAIQATGLGAASGAFRGAAGEAARLAESTAGYGAMAAFGSTQSMALTAALRHMFDAIVAGRPPLQALFMETGNLTYGLSGAGGFAGALRSVGSSIGGFLVTPVGMAVTAIAVLGTAIGAVVIAGESWASSQRTVANALGGAGSATDATVKGIDDMATAMAGASRLSISEVTKLATALAGTGKVGMEMIGQLVAMAKNFAVTFGQSNAEAAATLSKAFSDPAKGAEDLNARLAILNPAMQQHLKNLMAANKVGEAQQLLAAATKSQLSDATTVTDDWSLAWTSLTNNIKNFWTSLGKGIDTVLGTANVANVDQYHAAQAQVTSLTTQLDAAKSYAAKALGIGATATAADPFLKQVSTLQQMLNDAVDKAEKYSAAMEKGAKAAGDASANISSMNMKSTVMKLLPDYAATGGGSDANMKGYLQTQVDVAKAVAADTVQQDKWKISQETADDMVVRATEALKTYIPVQQKAIDQSNLQRAAVDGLAPGQRAALAIQNDKIKTSGQEGIQLGVTTKGIIEQNDAYIASGGLMARLQQEREHITLLGATATSTDVVRGKVIALQEANLRLDPQFKLSPDEIAKQGRLFQVQEDGFRLQQKITAGIATEDQIRKVLDNDEFVFGSRRKVLDASNEADQATYEIAREKRFKKMMEDNAVAGSRFPQFTKASIDAQDFTKQLDTLAVSGVDHLADSIVSLNSKTMSLGDTFKALGVVVINELEKMIIKMTLFNALGNGTAAGGGLSGWFAGLLGGGTGMTASQTSTINATLPPTFSLRSGGMVGVDGQRTYVHPAYFDNAPRMVTGGMITDGGVPIIAHPGERVLNRQQTAAYNSGGGSVGQTFVTNVTVTGSDITKAQVEALVVQSHKKLAKDINNSLPDRVAAINRDPRAR